MMRSSAFLGCVPYVLFLRVVGTCGDLIINARNQGEELLTEVLSANVTDETILLEFQRTDGTLITQLTDFRNGASLMRVIILGEEELNRSGYQVMCFLSRPASLDVITPEALSKLRQKNPGTIRIPEDDKGVAESTMDVTLLPELELGLVEKHSLSPHLASLCAEAANAVYARENDVKFWHSAAEQGSGSSTGWSYVRLPSEPSPSCKEVGWHEDADTGCTCRLDVSVPWYPCGLKFCPLKDSSGNTVDHRCGIQTCRQSYRFIFRVPRKRLCLWDV